MLPMQLYMPFCICSTLPMQFYMPFLKLKFTKNRLWTQSKQLSLACVSQNKKLYKGVCLIYLWDSFVFYQLVSMKEKYLHYLFAPLRLVHSLLMQGSFSLALQVLCLSFSLCLNHGSRLTATLSRTYRSTTIAHEDKVRVLRQQIFLQNRTCKKSRS